MLDNPDEYGIFPTTIAYDKLEEYIKSIERKTKIENRIMELRAQEYIVSIDEKKDIKKCRRESLDNQKITIKLLLAEIIIVVVWFISWVIK